MKTSTSNPNATPAMNTQTLGLHWGITLGLAVPMLVFGLNKFLFFVDVPPPEGQTAQIFLGAMFTSYLAPLVAVTEILGGALLLFRRTSFLGLLILTPLMANIIAFHIAHAMPGNGIWIFSTAFYGAALFRHRRELRGLIVGH